jgi:hypothetical protein
MSDQTPQRSQSDLTIDRVNNQLSGKVQEYHELGHPVQHDSAQVMLYPKHQPIQAHVASIVLEGKATAPTIFRAYKNTPHSPVAMLGKYIVHRVNNVDSYDSPATAAELDHKFMVLHKRGKAAEKNGHVSVKDLHMLMAGNPGLVRDMVHSRDRLHGWIKGGCGLNVREIEGQPHVALTRGLNTQVMSKEHALASFSDKDHSGFGNVQHHVWVPLNDIWFTFMASTDETRGNFGHENEILASNTGTRYQAEKSDVTKSVFPDIDGELYKEGNQDGVSSILASASPERVVESLQNPKIAPMLISYFREQPTIPPAIAHAIYRVTGDSADIVSSSEVPEEEVARWFVDAPFTKSIFDVNRIRERALSNPNLSPSTLINAVSSQWFAKLASYKAANAVLSHPNANPDVHKALLATVLHNKEDAILNGQVLRGLLESNNPPKQVQDVILASLTQSMYGSTTANPIRGAWGAIQMFKGTKQNEVINTDFTDKLIAINIADRGHPNEFVVRAFPLSDTALSDMVARHNQALYSVDRNPFLTPRQIAILGNEPYILENIAFYTKPSPEITKLAREALFRLDDVRTTKAILNRLEFDNNNEEPDGLTDRELVKVGEMARRQDPVYMQILTRLSHTIPVTRLNAWKNILAKPDSVDKLVSAIRGGALFFGDVQGIATDLHSPADRDFAISLAKRIVAASEGAEEDPREHLVVPLPRVQ